MFFVSSGVRFDLDALLSSSDAVLTVPLFLAALLVIRGLPALAYRAFVGTGAPSPPRSFRRPRCRSSSRRPRSGAARADRRRRAAALVAAGLLSLVIFPLAGLTILRGCDEPPAAAAALARADQSSATAT